MFGFTDDAAVLIRSLITDARLGPGSGLRMSITRGHPGRASLAMSLAARPGATDRVITRHDVRVFLDPAAAGRLHTRTLDAQVTDRPAFFLRDR
ncbi:MULTISPECIES: adhesin [unclassified Pseudonocardia]|uniref:adhesin n=1 Tax=unclassified Pseudonocardia TaxID=2619320 RepID=UPI00095D365F|nr:MULTISPECIES: adhesin [unclassified Pseudonocardia]MBN9096683.1 adhesin [Pseudonocardia sp.]OJY46347.1 MAG: hypothetical protein BGP03_26935 [Pseudonocardia sp. 73-21]